MPLSHDTILMETVRTRRTRLQSALLHGGLSRRRVVPDNVKRLVGSLVLAAVACLGCVGFAVVTGILAGGGNPGRPAAPPATSPVPPAAAPAGQPAATGGGPAGQPAASGEGPAGQPAASAASAGSPATGRVDGLRLGGGRRP